MTGFGLSDLLSYRGGQSLQIPGHRGHIHRIDDLLHAILFDASRSYRFEATPEFNVVHLPELHLLSRTASPVQIADDREVAILESKQQRDAILLSRDFGNALEALVGEELFSTYDLTQAVGVTRAMLGHWRDRPLEKVRGTTQARMGRLLFAWKYWLHTADGDPLGRYIRHIPEGSSASLLDLLGSDPTDHEIANLIDRLARYAERDRREGARRRRDVGGLPSGYHRQELSYE